VISNSHLGEIAIFSTYSNILSLNLYTHKLAKFHTNSVGFSIISVAREFESCLKTQYFDGSSTSFTKAQ
jgi:hypothetical protein